MTTGMTKAEFGLLLIQKNKIFTSIIIFLLINMNINLKYSNNQEYFDYIKNWFNLD